MKIFIGIVLYKPRKGNESQSLDYERDILRGKKYMAGLKINR